MGTAEKLMFENEHLKTFLKEKDEAVKAKDGIIKALEDKNKNLQNQNDNLKKLEAWYIEQLKLKAQQQFGKSSEKNEGQISLFDLFNKAEGRCQGQFQVLCKLKNQVYDIKWLHEGRIDFDSALNLYYNTTLGNVNI